MALTPFDSSAASGGSGETTKTVVRRFVILHHSGYGRDHWDLMLEQSQSLATWKVYHEPGNLTKGAIEVFRIVDHRKAYLDYEGPVSDNRGEVRRVYAGTYILLQKSEDSWQVRLKADNIAGEYEMTCQQNDRWVITKVQPRSEVVSA